jgi:hypothetical protein
MPRPPDKSREQRLDALERANRIRSYRAELKRKLRAGRVTIRAVLIAGATDERLRTAKVMDLLLATPKVGRVKADKLLRAVRVSPSKTLGGLSERQRGELLELLAGQSNRDNREDRAA